MYERYRIETSPIKLASTQIGKFDIVRKDNCLNCGQCISHCIYDVHRRDEKDHRKMAEPVSHLCKNCFACIQNCPQQALEMVRNEEFECLGDAYWTPPIINTIWKEAEEGKIPIYGAGYRGRFKGSGFDAIWTDMSEIVRPTRDGIHSREYIATAVDVGRKLSWITDFDNLDFPRFHEIQIPMLFEADPLGIRAKNIILAIVKAAHHLGTLAYIDIENCFDELEPYIKSLIFRSPLDRIFQTDPALLKKASFVELILPESHLVDELEGVLTRLKRHNPAILISLGLSSHLFTEELFKLVKEPLVDVLNLSADHHGQCSGEEMFICESARKLHLNLVKRRIRDEITLLGKGGIAAAEHVPKLLICGTDAAVLDHSLMVALGCRMCEECRIDDCPAELLRLDPEAAEQRILNLTCAWRDQLLEVLSAMGIRDVRRLRGEAGRAMFYEEIERESFGFIFEERYLFK
jgi:Pyruvate/2-oxoacid:ferredoxin oxidoreductase delta subunit